MNRLHAAVSEVSLLVGNPVLKIEDDLIPVFNRGTVFQVFLAEYDTKRGELLNLATVAQWNYETNITDSNSDIAQVKNKYN